MYLPFKREVIVALCMVVVAIAVSGLVAFMDLFQNDSPWPTWLVLSGVSAIASSIPLLLTVSTDDIKEYWECAACVVLAWITCGTIVVWVATSEVSDSYDALLWALVPVALTVYVVSSLLTYLFGETYEQQIPPRDRLFNYTGRN